MITYKGLNWLSVDCNHRLLRDQFVEKQSYDDCKISYDDYQTSLYEHVLDCFLVKHSNFEKDYRRRSSKISFNFDKIGLAKAYLPVEGDSRIHISEGLLLAIEDAAQSITSDSRSKFAINQKDVFLEKMGMFPGVIWSPELSKFLDQYRFYDYSFVIDQNKKSDFVRYSLFYKFLSQSSHRRKLADFISSYSLSWILAHEDAHIYLGHKDAFQKSNGFGAFAGSSMPFLEEFVKKNSREEDKTRLASEVAADTDASIYLVDSMAWMDAFEVYPFLSEYVSYQNKIKPLNDGQWKYLKTIYLFRLCVLSQVIALCVFERNTIKSSFKSNYYPTLSTRIMNCLTSSSSRFHTVSEAHPNRNISKFGMEGWQQVFRIVATDIDIVLKYMFDIGFVLNDTDIEIMTKEDVLDYPLGKKELDSLALALNIIGQVNMSKDIFHNGSIKVEVPREKQIEILSEVILRTHKDGLHINNSMMEYLDDLYDLMMHQSSFMLKYREAYQSSIRQKVVESHSEIENIVDTYNIFREIVRK